MLPDRDLSLYGNKDGVHREMLSIKSIFGRVFPGETGALDLELERAKGVGIWKLGGEYIQAAQTVQPQPPKVCSVSYFLYGHGLELALKAFIVSQGSTERNLRRIGHNLERALLSAEKHSSFAKVAVSANDRVLIAWINSYYKDKEFEYLVTGFKRFPNPDVVRTLCTRMHADLKPVIWTAVRAHISTEGPETH